MIRTSSLFWTIYGVRHSKTNSGDIPTSSNASYGVTIYFSSEQWCHPQMHVTPSQMNDGGIPTSSKWMLKWTVVASLPHNYSLTPSHMNQNGGDIPTFSNASYGLTPSQMDWWWWYVFLIHPQMLKRIVIVMVKLYVLYLKSGPPRIILIIQSFSSVCVII